MYNKYEINNSFFKNLNRDSAYVLGWIASDGCIQYIPQKKYSIRFELKDLEILELIKFLMNSTHPIKAREDKNTYTLVIDSKPLVKQLMDLGIGPAKTHNLQFPNIPKELYIDFIRGYFDGDGSVSILTTNHGKNKQLRSYICSANKDFLQCIGDYLKDEINLIPKIYEDKPNFFKLVYGAQESYALYKFMYEDTNNYLKRKKDIFEQAIEIKAGIGLTNCTRCGKEFVKTGKVQKYCRDCKKEVIKENDRRRYEKKKREKN